MSKYRHTTQSDQSGSALIITILVMTALTVIGILTLNTSSLDLKIAANDEFQKMTFYATDGGCQMTTELLEQNIEKRGFGDTSSGPVMRDSVSVYTGNFYTNNPVDVCPSPTNRDVQPPLLGQSNVYVKVSNTTIKIGGTAQQMAAGDKGRGKGIAGGGAGKLYNIRCLGQGLSQSETKILINWLHKI